MDALLHAELPYSKGPLFDPQRPATGQRWIRIVKRFESGGEYLSLVRKERAKAPWILDFLLNQAAPVDTGEKSIFPFAYYIKMALEPYPAFLKHLHDQLELPMPSSTMRWTKWA
jgi:hypothetical protein